MIGGKSLVARVSRAAERCVYDVETWSVIFISRPFVYHHSVPANGKRELKH